ncbi:hypothetical protein MGN70_008644 [Eutypa lata]|nr:hypothetical protein MGN70_008644 [Eutypa lata]
MADKDHPHNGLHNIRRSLSGNSVPTKPVVHVASTGALLNEEYSLGSPRRKTHKKSPNVLKDIDDAFALNGGGTPKQVTASKPQREPADASKNGSSSDVGQPNITSTASVRSHVPAPSTISNLTALSKATNESGSSSGSGSTVRNSSASRRDDPVTVKARNKQRRISVKKPNALNFLDSDSPDLTPDVVQHSIEAVTPHESPMSPQSTSPSNRSASSTSSGFQDDASDMIEDHETDRSTSPERSINGGEKGTMRTPVAARIDTKQIRRRSYGPPDLPYATLNQQPYMSPNASTPRAANQGPFTFPPRPERIPLTGYELIASRLCTSVTPAAEHNSSSSSSRPPPPLKPLYRRFETLHHRILLHLQDEICDLEEQLHRLDNSDTQSRRMQEGCIPASRRAEQHSGNEMHWHRLEVMSKIGFKLEQYDNVLSSYRKTQFFPSASQSDVHEYRNFLATHGPIVEAETHFLDVADDLICVNEEEEEESDDDYDDDDDDDSSAASEEDDALATPMPRNAQFNLRSSGGGGSRSRQGGGSQQQHQASPTRLPIARPENPAEKPKQVEHKTNGRSDVSSGGSQPPKLMSLSLAMVGAILFPVLAFAAIPGFVGRMAVVFVVLIGGVVALLQQGDLVGLETTMDICVCAGCYGAVMAVLAGVMG